MSDFEELFRQRIPLGEAAAFFIGIKKFAAAQEDPKEKALKSLQGGAVSGLHSLARREVMDNYQKSERAGDLAGRVGGAVAGGAVAALAKKHRALTGIGGAAVGQHLGSHIGRHFGRKADVERFRDEFKKKAETLQTNEGAPAPQGLGVTKGLVDDTETFDTKQLQKQTPKLVLKKSVDFTEKRAMFKRALEEMGLGEPRMDSELDVREVPVPVPTQQPQLEADAQKYIMSELMGQLAERSQESEYFKQVASQAMQQAQGAQQAAQAANEQAMQAQQAADAANQQIQQAQQTAQQVGEAAVASAATAHSIAAQAQKQQLDTMNEAAMHRQLSANLRAGVISMKQRIAEALQQDETATAEPLIGAPPTGAPAPVVEGPPAPPPGGALPEMAPPPMAPPPGGMPEVMKMAETLDALRAASPALLEIAKQRGPYALAGGALGVGAVLQGAGRHAEGNRAEVARLEAQQASGSPRFGDSMRLAKAKMSLAINEFADKHPYAAAAMAGMSGATTGAVAGPQLVSAAKRGYGLLRGKP